MLTDGLAYLTGQLRAAASQTVVYGRGGDSVTTTATLGRKLLRLNDDLGGLRMEWTDLDVLIPSAGLILSGTPVVPTRGDFLLVTIGDQVQRYEVRPYGNEPCWRWCDPGQTMIRIHFIFIGVEP